MPVPPPNEPARRGRVLRILYAEDLRDLREVARIALTRDGHSIECVADGVLALERIKAAPNSLDLLITDHHMPKMNGLELVTALGAEPFAGKIIVFSSELSPAIGAAYLQLGVDRILPKPIFPSELRQVLAEVFPPEASPP
jgi:CheY-like chemotaxis protein